VSHSANKTAKQAPCGLLDELAGGESEYETVDQDSAQVLFVTTLARGQRAAFYQRVDPGHLIGLTLPVLRDDWPPDWAELATTPCRKCQVVGVRDNDREVNITTIQHAAELPVLCQLNQIIFPNHRFTDNWKHTHWNHTGTGTVVDSSFSLFCLFTFCNDWTCDMSTSRYNEFDRLWKAQEDVRRYAGDDALHR
jgi:hypothetical protein